MAGIPGIRRLLRLPESEGSMARAVEEELAFHVDERTAELIEGGQEPAAARAEARRAAALSTCPARTSSSITITTHARS